MNTYWERFNFGEDSVDLCLPVPGQLQSTLPGSYNESENPYWSRVWPSAIALAEFITENPAIIKDKIIAEPGAGLGLPSLVAARTAKHVFASDISGDAVKLITLSAVRNQLKNIQTTQEDWNNLIAKPEIDCYLLSDINYNPSSFDNIYSMIMRFKTAGSNIILATPQRLLAKPLVTSLLPFITQQTEKNIILNQTKSIISIMQIAGAGRED